MLTDLSILLFLIVLNGLFAMSEIAIVSARRARLQQLVEDGSLGAQRALALGEEPTRFLSTVQVGITAIGILAGALGESAIADKLYVHIVDIPVLAPYAEAISLTLMVIILTYASLIIGELVPKRVAMQRPELIATIVARPMQWLSSAARPVVALLSFSTDFVLRVIGARASQEPSVTEEEIRVMIQQGTHEGVFDRAEQEMVSNVLLLDDRTVGSVMTPRKDLVFLDVQLGFEANRERLAAAPHSVLPLCDGGLEQVLGVVRTKDLVEALLRSERIDLLQLAIPPLFVPRSINLMQLLEHFKRSRISTAIVIDEYGEVLGVANVTDVIEAIVGDLPGDDDEDPMVVQRADGSWLVDGMLDLDALKRLLSLDELPEEEQGNYHTVGGLAMLQLGRVPSTGDIFELGGVRFEIVDMDKNRVDKLLVSFTDPTQHEPTAT